MESKLQSCRATSFPEDWCCMHTYAPRRNEQNNLWFGCVERSATQQGEMARETGAGLMTMHVQPSALIMHCNHAYLRGLGTACLTCVCTERVSVSRILDRHDHLMVHDRYRYDSCSVLANLFKSDGSKLAPVYSELLLVLMRRPRNLDIAA